MGNKKQITITTLLQIHIEWYSNISKQYCLSVFSFLHLCFSFTTLFLTLSLQFLPSIHKDNGNLDHLVLNLQIHLVLHLLLFPRIHHSLFIMKIYLILHFPVLLYFLLSSILRKFLHRNHHGNRSCFLYDFSIFLLFFSLYNILFVILLHLLFVMDLKNKKNIFLIVIISL